MRWTPRDAVALVLALCVLAFIVSGTSLRMWLLPESAIDAKAWEGVIGVIVGVLAAYISSRSAT